MGGGCVLLCCCVAVLLCVRGCTTGSHILVQLSPQESRKQAASKGKATAKEGDDSVPAPAPLRRQLSLEFRQALPEGRLTMAQLQGHFMKYVCGCMVVTVSLCGCVAVWLWMWM